MKRGAFEESGYLVVPSAIAPALCDRVVDAFQREVKPAGHPISRFARGLPEQVHRLDGEGHVQNPIGWRSPFDLGFPGFAEAVMECQSGLTTVVDSVSSGLPYRNAGLFEVSSISAGFGPHQDKYYSSLKRAGRAAWLALEDIHPEAGPLYVCPDSRGWVFWSPSQEEYTQSLEQAIRSGILTKIPLLLKKGDVVIFDWMLVHGPEKVIDSARSRYALSLQFGH